MSQLSIKASSELGGCNPGVLFKEKIEIRLFGESDAVTNVPQSPVCLDQQGFGFIKQPVSYVCTGVLPGIFLSNALR